MTHAESANHPRLTPLPIRETAFRQACRRVWQRCDGLSLGASRLEILAHHVDRQPAGIAHRVHTHAFYEMIVLLEGRARAGAGDVTWELQPGDALLWTPGQAHGFTVDPASPCHRWNLWFACAPALPAPATPILQQHPTFQQDFALWWEDMLGHTPGWEYRVRGRLELLLHWLVTAHLPARADPGCPTTLGDFLERIEAYLQDNLANMIILDDLAVHLGVSVSTVTRAFRQAHGISIMEHLQTLRMREAVTLLEQTDLPVAVIGARIGLDDPSYFCRRFRQYYRVTPLQYRRQGITQRG